MQVTFYKLKNNFMSWKFILRVGSKSTSCKLMFYELKVYNDNFCMFWSCLLPVEHLKCQFYELPLHVWIKFQENKSL